VCGFIGEPFVPEMLAMPGAEKHRGMLEAGGGHGLLSEDFIGRHRGRIPPRELAFMQLHAGRRMRAFGYEPDPVHLGARGRAAFVAYEWPRQMARLVAWRGTEELQVRFPTRVSRVPGSRMIVDDVPTEAGTA
jgi:hypothetical protein